MQIFWDPSNGPVSGISFKLLFYERKLKVTRFKKWRIMCFGRVHVSLTMSNWLWSHVFQKANSIFGGEKIREDWFVLCICLTLCFKKCFCCHFAARIDGFQFCNLSKYFSGLDMTPINWSPDGRPSRNKFRWCLHLLLLQLSFVLTFLSKCNKSNSYIINLK